ncbi:MAG: FtsX-like permease family protein [Geobacter sp.]|nr:MAG: FtsX-like permease family protein [Geobacter sp.]
MLLKMVTKSLVKNPRMTAWTMLTLVACASLITLFTAITFDLDKQMAGALRRLGANATAIPSESAAAMNETTWQRVAEVAGRKGTEIVRLDSTIGVVQGSPVAVVLAEPNGLARMTPYWSVTGTRASRDGECTIGRKIAQVMHLKPGMKLGLKLKGAEDVTFAVTGVVDSGDDDEDKIFLPQASNAKLFEAGSSSGRIFHYALLSVPNGETGIRELSASLAPLQTGLQVKPLHQILHGETATLDKIAILSGVSLITVLLLTGIGISAAVMARIVERRKELALLQAIGAKRRSIVNFLILESVMTGCVAVLIGFGIGTFVSKMMVLELFRADIAPSLRAFAFTALVTMGVTIFTGGTGALRGLRIKPAVALKGE